MWCHYRHVWSYGPDFGHCHFEPLRETRACQVSVKLIALFRVPVRIRSSPRIFTKWPPKKGQTYLRGDFFLLARRFLVKTPMARVRRPEVHTILALLGPKSGQNCMGPINKIVWGPSIWDPSNVWDPSIWDPSNVWDPSIWDPSIWDPSIWDQFFENNFKGLFRHQFVSGHGDSIWQKDAPWPCGSNEHNGDVQSLLVF
jgi:hypothetical protein